MKKKLLLLLSSFCILSACGTTPQVEETIESEPQIIIETIVPTEEETETIVEETETETEEPIIYTAEDLSNIMNAQKDTLSNVLVTTYVSQYYNTIDEETDKVLAVGKVDNKTKYFYSTDLYEYYLVKTKHKTEEDKDKVYYLDVDGIWYVDNYVVDDTKIEDTLNNIFDKDILVNSTLKWLYINDEKYLAVELNDVVNTTYYFGNDLLLKAVRTNLDERLYRFDVITENVLKMPDVKNAPQGNYNEYISRAYTKIN